MTGPLLFPAPSRAAERTSVFSPLHFPPAFTSLLSCRVSFFPSLHPSPQAAELPDADRGSFTPSGWGVWGGGMGSISSSENSGHSPIGGCQLVGAWKRDLGPLRWLLP